MPPQERLASTDEAARYGAVSNALWEQRQLLEALLYRLVTEQLVLTSGATRWLAKADDDVRRALDNLRAGELNRAMQVDSLLVQLGGDREQSLAELAASAPGMWVDVLTEHRTALRELAFEVGRVSDENQKLLHAGAKAVRDTLAGIGNVVRRYDATGNAVQGQPRAFLLDEQA